MSGSTNNTQAGALHLLETASCVERHTGDSVVGNGEQQRIRENPVQGHAQNFFSKIQSKAKMTYLKIQIKPQNDGIAEWIYNTTHSNGTVRALLGKTFEINW